MSPGGRGEVLEILRDVELRDKRMLDIGCGTGGPDIVVANALKPRKIVGIDIDPDLIQQAKTRVGKAGLDQIIDLRLVTPGRLPFSDATFDVVFSKDSLIHIVDKTEVYKEILRVLKPGGVFAASDWLAREGAETLEGFRSWRALTPHSFAMQTSEETRMQMQTAGFSDIATRDRNAWYAETALREVRMMESEDWKNSFALLFGADAYTAKLALRVANAKRLSAEAYARRTFLENGLLDLMRSPIRGETRTLP